MPNRAERRKAAKDQRRGVPSQYDQTRGRARSGMLDEYALQEKSRRIQEGVDDSGVWKPSARTEVDEEVESVFEANPNYQDPKAFKAPHSVRQWFRVGSWTLIALSVIAFFVVMWLPTHPLWLILTVSVVFGRQLPQQPEPGRQRHRGVRAWYPVVIWYYGVIFRQHEHGHCAFFRRAMP